MDAESRCQSTRKCHIQAWAIVAMALVTTLAACGGQAANNEQATATAQADISGNAAAPSATVAASAVVLTQPASTETLSLEPAPTATLTQAAAVPVCKAPAALTPPLTEGPFFKAGSPERSSLLSANIPGTKLVLTGSVLTAECKPVVHALLDFWQADSKGNYDNSGYTLRGHQFTDASGRYSLGTIVPGLYPGRTEHIHVKVQAPGGPVLTTQLFFPGVAGNQSDGIFDSRLLMNIQDSGVDLGGTFDFVVAE